ncbi:MAG: hypothetical protein J6D10_13185, partial [Clostridia bacterium]|nr:hypothetical protein [Clostridia bacterium]
DSVLGGTLTCTTEYVRYSPAGTYSITGSGLTAKNYDITFVPGTLTVNKAESHTITLGNLQQKRGELTPVTAEIEPQDETAVIKVEYEHSDGGWSTEMPVSSGEYNVRASLTESSNIEVTGEYFTEVLTIEKAVLTVTVSDLTLFYGDEWTEELCDITVEGLLDGDDISVLEGTMAYTCDYEQYGEPGTYTINGSGLTSENYDITFVPGTLTVNKAKEHTITLGNLVQRRGETSPVTTVIFPQDDSAVITVEYQHEDGVWSTELPDAVGEFNVRASLESSDRIEATGDIFTAVLTIKAGATIGGEDENTGVELEITDTTVEVIVPDEALDEIIENVPESGELVISVLNTEGAAETKDLILPGNLMQSAAENEAVSEVTVTADNTEITMNSKVLNKISSEIDAIREETEGETTEKINLSIDDVPEEKMTEAQKKAVEKMGNNPVLLELTLTVTSFNEENEVVAEEKLHKLGGSVKVRAAYDLGEDMEGARIVVCYVDEKGTPSYVPATYSDGYVEFTTNHFSFFLICTTEKPLLIGDVNDDGEVNEEDLIPL